jgi:hypothetical protein
MAIKKKQRTAAKRRKPTPRRISRPGDVEKKMLRDELGWQYYGTGKTSREHHGLPPGIVGVGFGIKRRNGRILARNCLRIYVRHKVKDRRDLDHRVWVPPSIRGIRTDVIELPRVVAHCQCGDSIGVNGGGIGTLACVVKKNGALFVLSNNHVIANLNQGQENDPIFVPAPAQGGNVIAALAPYPQVAMGGVPNPYDVALGAIADGTVIDPTMNVIGPLNLPAVAPATVAVTKFGASTQQTFGKVDGLNEDINVMYNDDPTLIAHFTGQIAILGDGGAPFSEAGDSGSLVVTQPGGQPMGLLLGGTFIPAGAIAGNATPHSFASPITRILGDLKLSIVTATG